MRVYLTNVKNRLFNIKMGQSQNFIYSKHKEVEVWL